MDTVYIDKRWYEIQEKIVPVWYAGIYRPISSTGARNTVQVKLAANSGQLMCILTLG
jgi:hypothetical protein